MDLSSPVPPRLTEALPDLAAWTAFCLAAPLPVMDDTALRLEELRAAEDAVDAHLIAEALAHDPLMTLKLLAHVAGVRSARSSGDPETLTSALVLLGIGPFFRAFGPFDGVKRDTLEGGEREPTLARWPKRIPAGSVNSHPSGHWDWLATFADLAGVPALAASDGVSLVPSLTGRGEQLPGTLYVEYFNNAGFLHRRF